MNQELLNILKAHIGIPLTPETAADIYVLANRLPTVVPFDALEKIRPADYQGFTFSVERMEDIVDEMRPLHLAHWNETEAHRHGLPFNPDYQTFIRYERAGRFILFTLRSDGVLLGNCAMYLTPSAHTQTLIAKEDTLFFLPEARTGNLAGNFIAYCENALQSLGVREISVSVKTVNKAGRFFRMLGYKHVENGLNKILEAEHA
jgi:N-acetylglutamate synthase-like GNAT family acetyltransferase